jgi:hypothetical protein
MRRRARLRVGRLGTRCAMVLHVNAATRQYRDDSWIAPCRVCGVALGCPSLCSTTRSQETGVVVLLRVCWIVHRICVSLSIHDWGDIERLQRVDHIKEVDLSLT